MQIVHFPHPTLRHHSKPLKKVDKRIKEIIDSMFELMYEAQGIGLAANQVDLPFRLFVVNLSGEKGVGEELVFINPVISRPKGSEEGEEGCLSIPGVYGKVTRPKQIRIQAFGRDGSPIDATVDGMLARVCQHEYDHLEGTMFFDRMGELARMGLQPMIEEFEVAFDSQRRTGGIPDDDEITERLKELESEYCLD